MIATRVFPLLLGALCLAGPALAAEGELLRDAMSGIGLIEPERPTIDYNERAPLVMPPGLAGRGAERAAPKRGRAEKGARAKPAAEAVGTAPLALPPPQVRQADPAWPKDPEVAYREREEAAARAPSAAGAQGRMNDNNMTLSPGEMAAGRRAGSDAPGGHRGERDVTWMNPLQLLMGRKEPADPDAPAVEPARDVLTDPPNGYRKAPAKVAKQQGGPVGNSISGNEEADPRAYMREQMRGR